MHDMGICDDFVCRTKDFYHTCYCLSGLSVAQHFADGKHACTHVIGNKELNEVVSIQFHFSIYFFTCTCTVFLSISQSIVNFLEWLKYLKHG